MLRDSYNFEVPIYGGLCHAPHLYRDSDAHSILYGSKPRISSSRRTRFQVLSTTQGTPYIAETASELYAAVVLDILTGVNFFGKLTDGMLNLLLLATHCHFLQIRTTAISNRLVTAIENGQPKLTLTTQDIGTWMSREDSACNPANHKDSKLAIVGMSCRLPGGANSTELFWELMMDGRDVHTTIPPDRFDLTTHYDASGKIPNTTETPFGNFIDKPGFFDASFFNMSPREVSPIYWCLQMRLTRICRHRLSRLTQCTGWRS